MHYEVSGRRLLNDISGYVPPGKLTALMGESGAGRVSAINEHPPWRVGLILMLIYQATLLNALAERTEIGIISGTRLVNSPLSLDFQQRGMHLATMTVREAWLFPAKLRQPFGVPIAKKGA